MSCLCEPNDIICVPVNPCNAGTTIDLAADETGTWTGQIEFNGTWISFEIDVVEDEKIIIGTHLLNENYVHEFRLYNVENDLFGCYKLQTMYTKGTANAIPIPVNESVSFLAYIGVASDPSDDLVNIGNGIFAKEVLSGSSFTDSRLEDLIVSSASINGQSYVGATWNYTKPVASGVFTFINGNQITDGDVLILYTSES